MTLAVTGLENGVNAIVAAGTTLFERSSTTEGQRRFGVCPDTSATVALGCAIPGMRPYPV